MFRGDYKKPDDINYNAGYSLSNRVQEGAFFSTRPPVNYYNLAAQAGFRGPNNASAGASVGAPAAIVDQYLLDPNRQQRVQYCSDFDVQVYDAVGNVKFSLPLELYPVATSTIRSDGKGRMGTPVGMPLSSDALDPRLASKRNCYYAQSDYP